MMLKGNLSWRPDRKPQRKLWRTLQGNLQRKPQGKLKIAAPKAMRNNP